jgi:ribosomal protein S18 acetylase RimI-like enzyme
MILVEEPDPDDAGEIFFVQRQTWHESYIDRISHEEIEKRFCDAPKRIEQVREKIEDGKKFKFFIARDDDKIVGFISLSRDPHAEVDSLYVLQSHQGLGLGRKLLEAGLGWFDPNELIELETSDDSVQKFYEKFGFQFVKNTPTEEFPTMRRMRKN